MTKKTAPKTPKKKLTVEKETIKELDDGALSGVAGGRGEVTVSCGFQVCATGGCPTLECTIARTAVNCGGLTGVCRQSAVC